jgi:Polysaccharide deacetylase
MLRSLFASRTVHTSALLGLFVAACGGDSSPGTEPTTTTSGTTVTPTPSVTPPTSSVQPTTTTSGPIAPPVTPTGPTGDTAGPTGDTSGPTGDTAGPTGDPTGPSGGESSGPTGTTTSPVESTGPSGGSSAPPDDTSTPPEPSGDANPSGLMEPGAGGVARPAGTAGNLVVLPWAGYAGAVTYSFDDTNSSQYSGDHGTKFLAHGVPFTWYLQTNKGTAGKEFYEQARDAGHELGNHSHSHNPDGNTTQDVQQAQTFIKDTYQVDAYTMASPNGKSDKYTTVATTLFIIDRGVNDGLIGADDNPNLMDLPSLIPNAGQNGIGQLGPKVDAAESQKKWQTFCIHGFEGGSDGAYNALPFEPLMEHITYAKTKNVWIGTMVDVGAYFIGRKLIKAAAAQGGVYTWNLPDVFPPGKYVRVTVDGGTLSQGGTPLPWNEHGFYEVALDAEELTVAP